MEPIAVLVGTSIALIISEASKEGGKSLGKAAFGQIINLKKLVASKLERKEESLAKAEPEVLEGELMEVVQREPEFAVQLANAVNSAQAYPEVRQIVLENTKGKTLKISEVVQRKGRQTQDATQIIGTGLEIDGEISISNIIQE